MLSKVRNASNSRVWRSFAALQPWYSSALLEYQTFFIVESPLACSNTENVARWENVVSHILSYQCSAWTSATSLSRCSRANNVRRVRNIVINSHRESISQKCAHREQSRHRYSCFVIIPERPRDLARPGDANWRPDPVRKTPTCHQKRVASNHKEQTERLLIPCREAGGLHLHTGALSLYKLNARIEKTRILVSVENRLTKRLRDYVSCCDDITSTCGSLAFPNFTLFPVRKPSWEQKVTCHKEVNLRQTWVAFRDYSDEY